jgi:hypothetical protein
MKKFLLSALAYLLLSMPALCQLTKQGQEQFFSGCTGSTCTLVTPNSPVNPNLLVNSGLNTFIIGVSPTTNSARLYITNDTANACANFTVSMASTGNSTLSSFNNNTQAWQSLQVTSGSTFASSVAITLPASGTVAITSQPIIGSRIVVFVVLSSGCNTTNIDMQVVFGTFAPPVSSVQGIVAPGSPATGENPILIAGKDNANNVRVPTVLDHTITGTANDGISIGGVDQSNGAQFSTFRTPAGALDGPLAISDMYLAPNGANLLQPRTVTGPNSGACFNGNSCAAVVMADTGYDATVTLNIITAGTNNTGLWQSYNFPVNNIANSKFETCQFVAKAVNTGGTTPTLDVYIQDSGDNSQWDDRIHFGQFIATAYQVAGIAGTSTNETIHVPQDGALAASTIVSGPIGMLGRVKTVAGGTGPAYTLTIFMSCK